MILPIRKLIKRKDLLGVLQSQFSSRAELGLEYIEGRESGKYFCERYRVYEGGHGEFNEMSQFVIVRTRKNGRIVDYTLEGNLHFS